MNTIINHLSLIADAADYLDRSTSAAWRIRAAFTNMAVWTANGYIYLEDNAEGDRLHGARVKLSTIRCWLKDCNNSALVLDLTPSAVRKTLGLEKVVDVHEDACRIARQKCMQTRSAANFAKYYQSALELAEARRDARERSVERIANLLSDSGWTLEGQIFDSRGYDTMYYSPTFVSDSDLYDEEVVEAEIDKITDTVANALESMHIEVDNLLAGAITTAKINKLSGYKVAIEQMMSVVGIDKVALAKRQLALEEQIAVQKHEVDEKAKRVEADIAAQLAEMATPEPAPKREPAVKTTAAERKVAREARLAAK